MPNLQNDIYILLYNKCLNLLTIETIEYPFFRIAFIIFI